MADIRKLNTADNDFQQQLETLLAWESVSDTAVNDVVQDVIAQIRARGAVLVPLGQLNGRVSDLPRDRELLLMCRTGGRSPCRGPRRRARREGRGRRPGPAGARGRDRGRERGRGRPNPKGLSEEVLVSHVRKPAQGILPEHLPWP